MKRVIKTRVPEWFYLFFKNKDPFNITLFNLSIRRDMSEQTMHFAASDQGLNCLPLIQQFVDTLTGRKMYWFKN